MDQQPTLLTSRLLLRPLTLADAATVQKLAGDYRIAQMTENIPQLGGKFEPRQVSRFAVLIFMI